MTTWRIDRGVARWVFSIPTQPHEDANSCLRHNVPIVIDALAGFGRVTEFDVGTFDRGDNTHILPGTSGGQLSVIMSAEPVRQIIMTLDLLVVTAVDGADTWIPNTGFLVFDIDDDPTIDSIGMWISIDIDIYSPVTWGKIHDNATLAAINNPRLARFLARVRACGAILDRIDEDGYTDHIDENGFH